MQVTLIVNAQDADFASYPTRGNGKTTTGLAITSTFAPDTKWILIDQGNSYYRFYDKLRAIRGNVEEAQRSVRGMRLDHLIVVRDTLDEATEVLKAFAPCAADLNVKEVQVIQIARVTA